MGKESRVARIVSWLFNIIYLSAILLALPWILWSAWKHGKYREGFGAKLWGQVPQRSGEAPCIWLHAVSVGEVNLLGCLLSALQQVRPGWQYVVSTTTKTGYDLAKKKYPGQTVFYCPLDFSWATRRAVKRMRPNLLVLAELELWPNLIQATRNSGAHVAIVNGRLSDSSLRGYKRIRFLVARVLQQIDLIAAQNEETASRFVALGATPEAVRTTGSLKFDGAQSDRNNPKTSSLRELVGFTDEDRVFLAGSTQEPEEAYAIAIYQKLLPEFPGLKLVLVPRHPERFEEVANLLEQSGLDWERRSKLGDLTDDCRPPVLLVDTVGELGAWWGTATVGFVGGSFGSRGGQNMLEPAAFGVATCFGPNTWNFRDIVSQLLAVDGAQQVSCRDELEQFVERALSELEWAAQMGQRARQLVQSQQGATEKTVEMLLPLVEASKLSKLSNAA